MRVVHEHIRMCMVVVIAGPNGNHKISCVIKTLNVTKDDNDDDLY